MCEDYEPYVYFSLTSPTTYSPGKCYSSAYIIYGNQVLDLHKLFKILLLTPRGELKSRYSVVGQSLVLAYIKKKSYSHKRLTLTDSRDVCARSRYDARLEKYAKKIESENLLFF